MPDEIMLTDSSSVNQERQSFSIAISIAELLIEHHAADTVVLDVSQQTGWTDYFVIATTRSETHLRGLLRHLDAALRRWVAEKTQRVGSLRRAPDDSGWVLVDVGDVVVHLMADEQRSFYELERLWFSSPVVFRDTTASPGSTGD